MRRGTWGKYTGGGWIRVQGLGHQTYLFLFVFRLNKKIVSRPREKPTKIKTQKSERKLLCFYFCIPVFRSSPINARTRSQNYLASLEVVSRPRIRVLTHMKQFMCCTPATQNQRTLKRTFKNVLLGLWDVIRTELITSHRSSIRSLVEK